MKTANWQLMEIFTTTWKVQNIVYGLENPISIPPRLISLLYRPRARSRRDAKNLRRATPRKRYAATSGHNGINSAACRLRRLPCPPDDARSPGRCRAASSQNHGRIRSNANGVSGQSIFEAFRAAVALGQVLPDT